MTFLLVRINVPKMLRIKRCDMPIAVTIFGVVKRDNPALFCYAFFRLVRGPGCYPAPLLPASAQINSIRRIPIEGFDGLDLMTGTVVGQT